MTGEYIGFAFQGSYVDVVDSDHTRYVLEVDVFGDSLHDDGYGFFEAIGYVIDDEGG